MQVTVQTAMGIICHLSAEVSLEEVTRNFENETEWYNVGTISKHIIITWRNN